MALILLVLGMPAAGQTGSQPNGWRGLQPRLARVRCGDKISRHLGFSHVEADAGGFALLATPGSNRWLYMFVMATPGSNRWRILWPRQAATGGFVLLLRPRQAESGGSACLGSEFQLCLHASVTAR